MLGPELLHEPLHRGIRPRVAVLVNEAVEHPLGGVALLARTPGIAGQPLVDHWFQPGQHDRARPSSQRRGGR